MRHYDKSVDLGLNTTHKISFFYYLEKSFTYEVSEKLKIDMFSNTWWDSFMKETPPNDIKFFPKGVYKQGIATLQYQHLEFLKIIVEKKTAQCPQRTNGQEKKAEISRNFGFMTCVYKLMRLK